MLRSIRCYVWFFCIVGILYSVTPLIAQIDRGTIEGLVKDPSGAVIPGATVKIIQTATNSTYELVTNGEGLYVAPNLPVATYRVVIQAAGFSTFSREPVEVRAHVQVRVDAVLQIGAVTDVSTVTAEAPLLDVSATSNSTGLPSKTVEKLPLIVSVYQRLYWEHVGHGGTFLEPHGGKFAEAATQWLLWQLKGDKRAGAMFKCSLETKCGLCTAPEWKVERKNQR
jgi:hypothetical protein